MFMIDAIPQVFRKEWFSKKTRSFLWATLGTVLEYYDYALYGLFAPFFAQDFFPNTNPTVALLKVFSIFFVGSLVKPFGSIIFGTIGDRWSVHQSLRLSIIGMALATFLMGILPGFRQWGSFAAFCLLLCRFLQSLSVMGESDSMQVFIYEQFGTKRSCLANSLCCMAWKIGIALGSVAYAWVMQQPDPASCYRWPFIVGALLGLLIFWQRRTVLEEHTAKLAKPLVQSSMQDLMGVVLNNKKILLAALFLCGSGGGCYYFYFIFLQSYSEQIPHFIMSGSILAPSWFFLYSMSSLIGALIADKIGALLLMRIAGYGLLLLSTLHVFAVMYGHLPLFLMGSTVLSLGVFQAPAFVSLFARVTKQVRCRTIFLGHAIGSLLFSSSTPVISLWLWQRTHIVYMPFIYFVLLVGLGLLGVSLLSRETIEKC